MMVSYVNGYRAMVYAIMIVTPLIFLIAPAEAGAAPPANQPALAAAEHEQDVTVTTVRAAGELARNVICENAAVG